MLKHSISYYYFPIPIPLPHRYLRIVLYYFHIKNTDLYSKLSTFMKLNGIQNS